MKKALTILSLLTVAAIAQAREGFYVGGQLGTGMITRAPKKGELNDTFEGTGSKVKKARFLGGIYGGYTMDYSEQFTFGPEVGFRYVQRAKYTANNVLGVSGSNVVLSHQMNILDVLAVGTYRLNPLWDIQGKAGAGVTFDKARANFGNSNIIQSNGRARTRTKVRPEVGVGVGYMVNEDMRVSVDALHLFGSRSRAQFNKDGSGFDFSAFKKCPSLTAVTVSLQYLF